MRNVSLVRASTASVVAVALAVALTSCSLGTSSEHSWKTVDAMRASAESTSVPSLVGSDATSIRLSTPPYGKGPTVLSWQSAKGVTRSDCTAGALGASPVATPTWWPASVPGEGQRCGWWRVFQQGDTYYSWQQLPNA